MKTSFTVDDAIEWFGERGTSVDIIFALSSFQ